MKKALAGKGGKKDAKKEGDPCETGTTVGVEGRRPKARRHG